MHVQEVQAKLKKAKILFGVWGATVGQEKNIITVKLSAGSFITNDNFQLVNKTHEYTRVDSLNMRYG